MYFIVVFYIQYTFKITFSFKFLFKSPFYVSFILHLYFFFISFFLLKYVFCHICLMFLFDSSENKNYKHIFFNKSTPFFRINSQKLFMSHILFMNNGGFKVFFVPFQIFFSHLFLHKTHEFEFLHYQFALDAV